MTWPVRGNITQERLSNKSLVQYRTETTQAQASEQADTFVPCVLDTSVFPTFLTLNTDGALISYQSFFAKGSTLQEKRTSRKPHQHPCDMATKSERKKDGRGGWGGRGKLTSSSWIPSSPSRSACSCRRPWLTLLLLRWCSGGVSGGGGGTASLALVLGGARRGWNPI